MAEATYGMNYSNFIGVDVSSDPRVVARNRLAHSVNMWRDYESEQGAAVETFPGFRRCVSYLSHKTLWNQDIRGIWLYKGATHKYVVALVGGSITYHKVDDLQNAKDLGVGDDAIGEYNVTGNYTAFAINNRFYVFSQNGINEISEIYDDDAQKYVLSARLIPKSGGYIPTTYYNGKPYEQRNAFGVKGEKGKEYQIVKEVYTGPSEIREFKNAIPDNSTHETIDVAVFKINEKTVESKWTSGGYINISSVTVDGIEFTWADDSDYGDTGLFYFKKDGKEYKKEFLVNRIKTGIDSNGEILAVVSEIFMPKVMVDGKKVEITYKVQATHFNTIGNLAHFQNDKVTMAEAILGCTKSAVYDGRVFLTGNPALPNTVFYSHRNLTGVNDPTYFGVYNYFNDGDGNTPNVDMLAMPNMLMVIKRDTTQDGSIYYHVGADNPHSDESVRNLVPRIYPSSTGAAGLGSAGLTDAYSLSCNFLDDPVFLSRRGLEGITKEQLNAERTVQHRSSTIDRFLIKEDLAHASLAEWKGYLVVCCNGHIYLADSRTRTQNAYGSFQYEWFYLEGVGTYDTYWPAYKKMTSYPDVEGFAEACKGSGIELWEKDDGEVLFDSGVLSEPINEMTVYYYENDNRKRLLDITDQRVGQGFHGAKRVLAVGELLFFATDHDICLFNTDKRGVPIKDDNGNIMREVDSDKIDSSWYTFDGVPYISGCSTRLDDCEKKTVTKANVYGTTVARFKMIPGSRCKIKSSINGRDWKKIGEGHASRFDFGDLRFDNTSFTENEDSVYVLPEVSRGWVSKQYYFYSDGFCEPFGLYELSYNYKIVGKIRR